MQRYIYMYMLFLAFGLFDTSNGASLEGGNMNQTSDSDYDEVKLAFEKFDSACNNYYSKISPEIREWIYVENELNKDKYKDFRNKGKNNFKNIEDQESNYTDEEIDILIKSLSVASQNIILENIRDFYTNENESNPQAKNEGEAIYSKVKETEQELDRLSKSKPAAFYRFVTDKLDSIEIEKINVIRNFVEGKTTDLFIYKRFYKDNDSKRPDFEKIQNEIYLHTLSSNPSLKKKRNIFSRYKADSNIDTYLNFNNENLNSDNKKPNYDLLTKLCPINIFNKHKFDSDIKLYNWYLNKDKDTSPSERANQEVSCFDFIFSCFNWAKRSND